MLAETNPIVLAITMVVSLLHSVFNFLAFKNDISFWKDKKRSVRKMPRRNSFSCLTCFRVHAFCLGIIAAFGACFQPQLCDTVRTCCTWYELQPRLRGLSNTATLRCTLAALGARFRSSFSNVALLYRSVCSCVSLSVYVFSLSLCVWFRVSVFRCFWRFCAFVLPRSFSRTKVTRLRSTTS